MNLFMTSVAGGVESIKYLRDNINEQTQLVVLPFAHHFDYINKAEDVYNHYDRCHQNKDSIYWRTVKPFIDIGINPDRIVIINVYDDPLSLIKQKLLADNVIVYLPGGFPENIVRILKQFKLVEVIKQCKIVVGESAGSMFWGKRFFVYPDNDYRKYQCFRGIKMTKGFVILPHYNDGCKRKILNATRRYKKLHKETVYLIEDGGWVWYDTETKSIMGWKDCHIYE